ESAQRRPGAELVLHLEREHVGDVGKVDGQVLVRQAVLVALKGSRQVAGDLERDRIGSRMSLRNDAPGKQAAGFERSGAGGRTLRGDDAAAAIRVENLHRTSRQRGGREIAGALLR